MGEWLEREKARHRERPRQRPTRLAPGPGQVSVWDFPRPPRLEPAPAEVRVEFAGETIARSARALRVCETASPPAYYLPPEDVRMEVLVPTPRRTLCEWKGLTRYFDVELAGRRARAAAWSYPDPDPAFAALRDHVAFHAGRVDACFVGPERATPQPGEYYGGWITRDLVGPFKGEPGSEGW